MSTTSVSFTLTANSYSERARLASRIQDECACAERGEKVDLNQTSLKLQGLVQALNQDSVAIGKTNVTRELHAAHLAHKKDLDGLTARVNALSSKANNVPLWVKPTLYKAVAVAGLAGLIFTAYQSGIFSSTAPGPQTNPPSVPQTIPSGPQTNPPGPQTNPPSVPQTIPSGSQTNLPGPQTNPPSVPQTIPSGSQTNPPSVPQMIPSGPQTNPPGPQTNPPPGPRASSERQPNAEVLFGSQSSFGNFPPPTNDPLWHSGTRVSPPVDFTQPLANSDVPFVLIPEGEGATDQEKLGLEGALKYRYRFSRLDSRVELHDISDSALAQLTKEVVLPRHTAGAGFLRKPARKFYPRCIDLISSAITTEGSSASPEKAYVFASKMRGVCLPLVRDVMKDRIAAEYLLPALDYVANTLNPAGGREELASLLDECARETLNNTQTLNCIIGGVIKPSLDVGWLETLADTVEATVAQGGKWIEQGGEFLWKSSSSVSEEVSSALGGLMSLTGRVISLTGGAIYFYPLSSGINAGAILLLRSSGLVHLSKKRLAVTYFAPHLCMLGRSIYNGLMSTITQEAHWARMEQKGIPERKLSIPVPLDKIDL